MHQAVRKFDFGKEKVDISQLSLMVANLQEEIQKLKIMNEKIILKLEQKEQRKDLNETRLMSYEREMQAFWNFQKEQDRQTIHLTEQVQKQEDKPPWTELSEIGAMQMEIEKYPIEKNVENQSRLKNYAITVIVNGIYGENVLSSRNSEKNHDNNKSRKEQHR